MGNNNELQLIYGNNALSNGDIVIGHSNHTFCNFHDCIWLGHNLQPPTGNFQINIGNKILVKEEGTFVKGPLFVDGSNVIGGSGRMNGAGVSNCCHHPRYDTNYDLLDLTGVVADTEFFNDVIVHDDLYVAGKMVLPRADVNGAVVLYNRQCHAWKLSVTEEMDLTLESKNGTCITFCEEFHTGVLNFTGSHMLHTKEDPTLSDSRRRFEAGCVVVATGEYCDLNGRPGCISMDDALPVVDVCSQKRDPRVFGVFSRWETKAFHLGHLCFPIPTIMSSNTTREWAVINSVGEGCIRVCDEDGDIRNGDLLASSSVPGMASRQDDDVVRACTIAKITCDCLFDDEAVHHVVHHGGKRYRWRVVGCSYKC